MLAEHFVFLLLLSFIHWDSFFVQDCFNKMRVLKCNRILTIIIISIVNPYRFVVVHLDDHRVTLYSLKSAFPQGERMTQ